MTYEADCVEYGGGSAVLDDWLALRVILDGREAWRFEVLDPDQAAAWLKGLAGAARIVISRRGSGFIIYTAEEHLVADAEAVRRWLDEHESDYEGFTDLQFELMDNITPRPEGMPGPESSGMRSSDVKEGAPPVPFVDGDPDAPLIGVEQRTIVHDLASNRQVMWLDGLVPLPIGAEIELWEPNVNVAVERVRWLAGDPGTLCLDVRVPDSWWTRRVGRQRGAPPTPPTGPRDR